MNRGELIEWRDFLLAESHVLGERPRLLFQQAANRPDETPPAGAARRRWETGRERRPWLRWINKPGLRDPCLLTLEGTDGSVAVLDFTPDGSLLLTGRGDATLGLWELRTGRAVAELAGHEGPVAGCGFSPDGSCLSSASEDGTVRLWSIPAGAALAVLSADGGAVERCAFVGTGERVVSVHADRRLRVWSADSGRLERTFPEPAESWAWTPDGETFASGERGGVAIRDATGRLLDVLEGGALLALSPDGTRVVTRTDRDPLELWDVPSRRLVATLAEPPGPADPVHRFSPDGRRIASVSKETIRVWDAGSGRELFTVETGHRGPISDFRFSPDRRRLVTASWDSTLKLWDAESGSEVALLRGHSMTVWACRFSPEGERLASRAMDGTTRLWTARARRGDPVPTGPASLIRAFHASGEEIRIVVGTFDHLSVNSSSRETLKLWDLDRGSEIATLADDGPVVTHCSVARDGSHVACVGREGALRLWDLDSGEPLRAPEGSFTACALDRSGDRLAVADGRATLRILDPVTGRGGDRAIPLPSPARALAWSPAGDRIACWHFDESERVRLVAVEDGREILELEGAVPSGGGRASDLYQARLYGGPTWAFSSDERAFACVTREATVIVVESKTGAGVAVLRHPSPADSGTDRTGIAAFAFSPDGARIATAGRDGAVRVWEANGGRASMALPHGKPVHGCAFSPDGERLVSITIEGSLTVWDASTSECIAEYRGVTLPRSVRWAPDGSIVLESLWSGVVRLGLERASRREAERP